MPSADIVVDPSNEDSRRGWDGNDGDYWTKHEETFNTALGRYHDGFMGATGIEPADQVLDVGCGTGLTTRDAARRAHLGSALGVDLSSRMLERARRRAADEHVGNVRFEHGDVQVYPFAPGSFDRAISRTGAMFFGDPVAAFTNIRSGLRDGGHMTLFVWRAIDENHWIRDLRYAVTGDLHAPPPPPDAPGLLSLSDPDRVRDILTTAGFVEIALTGVSEPMCFGRSADAAQEFVLGLGMVAFALAEMDDDSRSKAVARIDASIASHVSDDGVQYQSAGWIVTARAARR